MAATNRLQIGDKIRLIPAHCDPTVNLYDWYVAIRNNHVEQLWPLSPRRGVLENHFAALLGTKQVRKQSATHPRVLRLRRAGVRVYSTTRVGLRATGRDRL